MANKKSDKLKIVLILGQAITALTLAEGLCKYQNDDYQIAGILSYFAPKKKALQDNLSTTDKLKKIFKSKGAFKAIIFLTITRWFASPNALVRKLIVKLLPAKKIRYQTIKELANKYKIAVLETTDVNSDDAKDFLNSLKSDLGIVCISRILKDYIFESPKHGCLNYHAGILPKYRGSAPIFWQLYYNDQPGYTIHKIDAHIDTGNIVLKKTITYQAQENLFVTINHIKEKMGYDCAKEIVKIIAQLKDTQEITAHAQDDEQAMFFKLPEQEKVNELEKRFKHNQLKNI